LLEVEQVVATVVGESVGNHCSNHLTQLGNARLRSWCCHRPDWVADLSSHHIPDARGHEACQRILGERHRQARTKVSSRHAPS
jgi:hypothetical protein